MGDELYKAVLNKVRSVPYVRITRNLFIPTEIKLDLPDVVDNVKYGSYVDCNTSGEIIVGFDTRMKRINTFGFLPWGKREEPLAGLEDIREELASVPEIGEPLSHDEHFLVYERYLGRRVSLKLFDLVVVGAGSFLGQYREAIQLFKDGRFGTYQQLRIDTPFAAKLKQAHVASYGR